MNGSDPRVQLKDSTILTSLSAKWRAPLRQREERLKVFSSPSSNTAETRVQERNYEAALCRPGVH